MDRAYRWIIAAITLLAFFLLGASIVLAAPPTITLTANPISGISPLSTTLTWSSSGAVSCSASGAWSGSKALSGSQTFSNLLADSTFNLKCVAADGSMSLTWVAPTTNTDGSPLADLASYDIHRASTEAGLPNGNIVNVLAPATAYQYTTLPPGTWWTYVKAVNSKGVRSDPSNSANKAVTTSSSTASVLVAVLKQPAPPTNVTIGTVVYDIRATGWKYALDDDVGRIALGVECGALRVSNNKGQFYEVPPDMVNFYLPPSSAVVVAKCSGG